MKEYSILINTCDKFEDCWDPFFQLFKTYWPDYDGTIYLNTEYKDYHYEGLNIIAIKCCELNNFTIEKQATWSQCLLWALEFIKEDIVLYMQEDYFFKGKVKNKIVQEFVQIMDYERDVDCIHLTDQSVLSEDNQSKYKGLYLAKINQKYRISCQAALWKKETLLKYIKPHEDAWQFEEFGSRRGAVLQHNFYAVDKNWVRLNHFEIIPYVFTGIVQGRWKEAVVPLFKKHNINVDYLTRGYVKDAPKRTFKVKLKNKIKKFPKRLKSNFDLMYLKLTHTFNNINN
jgi:hypothetical protein